MGKGEKIFQLIEQKEIVTYTHHTLLPPPPAQGGHSLSIRIRHHERGIITFGPLFYVRETSGLNRAANPQSIFGGGRTLHVYEFFQYEHHAGIETSDTLQ